MSYNFLFLAACAIILFALGSLPAIRLKFHKGDTFLLNLFLSNLLVILILVSVYAIIKSCFHSVHIVTLLVLITYLNMRRPGRAQMRPIPPFILPGLIVLLTTLISYVYILPKSIEGDVTYYAKVSAYLLEKGTENYYSEYNDLLTHKAGLMPYHYFELWLAAGLSAITGFTTLVTLKFIVYPYLMALVFIGMAGLYEFAFQKKANAFVFWVTPAFFLASASLGELISIKCSGWEILMSPYLRPNFILYYLWIILLLPALFDRDLILFSFSTVLLLLLSVTAVPVLFFSVAVYLFYLLVTKRATFKQLLVPIAFIGFFTAAYGLFYILNASDVSLIESRSTKDLIWTALRIWKATLGAFLNLSARILLFVPVFIFLRKKNILSTDVIIFLLISTIGGIGLFQLLNQLDNSYQIPHPAFCFFGSLLLLSLYYFMERSKTLAVASVLIFVTLAVFANRSNIIPTSAFGDNRKFFASKRGLDPDFVSAVADKMSNFDARVGFYIDSATLARTELRYRVEITAQPMQEIGYYSNHGNMVCTNTAAQIKTGEGRGLERLEQWYSLFPQYASEKNPFVYLERGSLGALLIRKRALKELDISALPNSINVVTDNKGEWCLYYKSQEKKNDWRK